MTVVEDVNKPRQPFKDMEAVYILEPSVESVNKVKADFPNKKGVGCSLSLYSSFFNVFHSARDAA